MTFDPERDDQLRDSLEQTGLDAVLAWHTEEVVLATGACSHLGLTVCLYPLRGEPVVYAPPAEPASALPDHLLVRRYEPINAPGLAAWADLKRQIMDDATRLDLRRIGYAPDGGRHAPPGNAGEAPPLHTTLVAALLEEVDALPTPDFFAGQMLRKTPREVERIRIANRAAAAGLRAFFDALHPGLTETEIAGRVEAAIQACTGRDGIGLARGWAYVQAGENALLAGPISRSSGYALREGDLVLLELGTFADGYWSDLTRVSVVGHPSQVQADLLATVRAAQRAALAAVRPGVTHAAVDAAARRVIEARGMGPGFTHATGHHVGFRWHDPGPMLAAGSDEPLEAGMVVTIEPGVYGPQFGGGARFEDNVLVTGHGAELLSPYDLIA